jgi:hypothetical protein
MAYSLAEQDSHLGESAREKTQREAREKQQAAKNAQENKDASAPQPQADTGADQKTKAKGSLRYPDDIGTDASSHYAIFEFYDYSPPFSKETLEAGAGAKTLAGYNTSANGLKKAAYPQIILYMPEGVAAAYAADWDGKALGNIATAGLKAAGRAAGGDYAKMISEMTSEMGRQFNTSGSTLGSQLTSALAKRVTGDSIGVQDVFSSIGGAILNPNVELIFGGHQLRTLQLNFKMVPYNLTEAKNVHEIVQTFKKVLLPKFNGGTNMSNFWKDTGTTGGTKNDNKNNNGFIGNPNLCKITFMQGPSKNKYITQFKTCAITDFQVNYTPDGVAAFGPDGYPVATQISLSFMETKLVYAEDVNSGY